MKRERESGGDGERERESGGRENKRDSEAN
jgi:hypothetical protein